MRASPVTPAGRVAARSGAIPVSVRARSSVAAWRYACWVVIVSVPNSERSGRPARSPAPTEIGATCFGWKIVKKDSATPVIERPANSTATAAAAASACVQRRRGRRVALDAARADLLAEATQPCRRVDGRLVRGEESFELRVIHVS